MLKLIVNFKSSLPASAREKARHIVEQVVARLHEKLALQVRSALTGALDRNRRTRLKVAQNLDPWATVRANLKNVRKLERTGRIHHARMIDG